MTLEIGTRLGHYRIVALLGRGGMAEVYRAEDERLGREVALKVLPPEFAWDPERVERFEREVRAGAKLNHANIVTVYEFGQGSGQHFYTMALMTGGDLKTCIRGNPNGMPVAEARAVAAAVARALDYAHRHGFVHRDVKPENILFDEDGTPQLTDFGIARAMAAGTRMTATGMSIGSPHYMSPEQARGLEVDGRSDLYSLGVVLYEMLTGRLPFDAGDTLAVAYAHVNDPVPELPSELAGWQPVVDRLLAKSPEDRYASAGELAAVLAGEALPLAPATRVAPVRREVGPTSQSEGSRTRVMEAAKPRRGMLGTVASAVVLVVMFIGYMALRDSKGPQPGPRVRGGGGGQLRPAPVRPDPPSKPEMPVDFGRRQPTQSKRLRPAADEGGAAEAALGLDRAGRQGIQQGLAAAGFDPGGADGVFGPGTRAALRAWQRARGASATGYLTRESAAELRAERAEARAAALERAAARLERRPERLAYGSLTLDLEPANAQVRLLNHKGSYRAGMKLPPGDYRVEVSAAGYETAVLRLSHGSFSTHREVRLRGKVLEEVAPGLLDRRRRAAEQGNASAQTNLGVMYANGRGVRKDQREAVRWYRKAAEQGHARAQTNLGFMYEKGRGVGKDNREAVRWYRKAAEQGHASAQSNLGLAYEYGRGVGKDNREAVRWYRKAAEQGYARAQNNLGLMYEKGRGVGKDYREAVGWYRKAAAQGNASAQGNLGDMFEYGKGVGKDYREAVGWYRKAAAQGHAWAQNNLGLMYEKGRGVGKDYREAVGWYRKAAAQGHASAQSNLGLAYEYGRGVGKDNREAVRWYRKAAEQGYARAQNNLGLMYEKGRGVGKDYREAVGWYRKAAAQGNASAQGNLGDMFEYGKGVGKDYREAVGWYRKAAAQGHAWAQNNLGLMYEKGRGVGKDYREAVGWYRKAAAQGHASAQSNLGLAYEYGRGVGKDNREAVRWYRKAAEQGHERAKKNLARLQ